MQGASFGSRYGRNGLVSTPDLDEDRITGLTLSFLRSAIGPQSCNKIYRQMVQAAGGPAGYSGSGPALRAAFSSRLYRRAAPTRPDAKSGDARLCR